MIISVCSYQILNRKGLLIFHQKTQNASNKSLAQKIFDYFELSYTETLRDQNSTRIRSVDDLGEPEIQLLENAKLRAMKSLPQNSLYWGNDLFHVHINQDNVFLKLPLWFKLHRVRSNVCELLELEPQWTKLERNKNDSLILSPQSSQPDQGRFIGVRELRSRRTFRVAHFLSQPYLNAAPNFCIDTEIAGDE